MQRNALFAAIAIAALSLAVNAEAAAKKPKSGHKFKGGIEVQDRSNDNISAAPSSGNDFDFADLSEFGDDEDAELGEEEEEEDGDFFEDVDDIVEEEFDDDELEEVDAIDEDGDGVDDLLDPNADNIVDSQNRFTIKLGLGHKYTFENGTTSWNNGIKFANDTHNGRSDLDKFNWAISSGFDIGFAERHALKPALSYVTLEKDDQHFVSTLVASLGYEFEMSKRVTMSAVYNYQDKDVTQPSSPDARIDTLSLGADFKITDDDIVKLKYAPQVEDSSIVTRNTDAWGYDVAYTRKLPWEMTLGIGYAFDNVEHKNLTPRREDDSGRWALQFTKTIAKKFTVGLGYERTDKRSNIPNKDAENKSLYIEAGYKF